MRVNDLSLSGDSCRYMVWGSSLARGNGFVDSTQLSPDRYVPLAPLYSLLLAPAEAVAPLSVSLAKTETLLWAIAALALFYFWILGAYGKRAAVWTTLLFALNPAALIYGTEVLPEAPFIALTILLLMLAERWTMADELPKARILVYAILLSALPLLREAGIALVLALVIALVSAGRTRRAIFVFVLPALLVGLWHVRNEIMIGAGAGPQIGNLALIT